MSKHSKNRFDQATEVRRVARQRIGAPPVTRKIGNKRKKPPKHKKPLREEY